MLKPRLPSFFKSSKPKQFDFKPRYYDEAKEQREERVKRIQSELENEKSDNHDGLKTKMREKWRKKDYASQRKNSNITIIIIVAILAILAYIFLY